MEKTKEIVKESQSEEVTNETQSIQITQEQILKLGGSKKLAETIVSIMKKRKKLTGIMAFTIAELGI